MSFSNYLRQKYRHRPSRRDFEDSSIFNPHEWFEPEELVWNNAVVRDIDLDKHSYSNRTGTNSKTVTTSPDTTAQPAQAMDADQRKRNSSIGGERSKAVKAERKRALEAGQVLPSI